MIDVRPAPAQSTAPAAELLQATLAELIDLSLQGKQAHWTVRGPNFRPLHEHLDELVTDVRGWYDDVAERLAALDVAPDGRITTVASSSTLQPLVSGWLADGEVVRMFEARLGTIATALGERIDRLAEPDAVSQDLLIGIAHGIEKHRWMFAAQLPTA